MSKVSGTVLDHVAIAVEELDKLEQVYQDLGLVFNQEREVVEEQKVKTSFAPIDANAHIELLEPLEGDGPIATFLAKKGPGIHHLCFKVEDVEAMSNELCEKGYQLIYPQPVRGAGHKWVNFIHPKSTGGVLIEISCPIKEE